MSAFVYAAQTTTKLMEKLELLNEQYDLMIETVSRGGQSASLAAQSRTDIESKIMGIQEVLLNRGELTDEVAAYHQRTARLDFRLSQLVDCCELEISEVEA